MQNMGGMGGLMGLLPGVAKMKNQIANANIDDKILKRQMAIIDSMTPKERRNPDILKHSRKKRIAAGSGTKAEDINKLLKMHRTMADMMKAMGGGKRGPLAGLARLLGMGGGMPTPEQMAKLAEKMPGGMPGGMPGLPPGMPGACRRISPVRPRRLSRPRRRETAAGISRPGEEEMSSLVTRSGEPRRVIGSQSIDFKLNTEKGNLKCLSSSASPAPAPRSGRSITSSSPTRASRATAASSSGSATSIRCCRRKTERLKLDLEKAKAWMAKGAQPSDRVMRFLDAAGVMKREARNNPEKAIPRKERKVMAEEAAKAKEAADAAAKAAATAKAAEQAAAS